MHAHMYSRMMIILTKFVNQIQQINCQAEKREGKQEMSGMGQRNHRIGHTEKYAGLVRKIRSIFGK